MYNNDEFLFWIFLASIVEILIPALFEFLIFIINWLIEILYQIIYYTWYWLFIVVMFILNYISEKFNFKKVTN